MTLLKIDTDKFLRATAVVTLDGAQAEALPHEVFLSPEARQEAFAALASGELELVPLERYTKGVR